ncbi:hypothetical protein G7Z17_g1552 [Cylindrodendrum hubeiense]|uniref:Uncharacterized protein n=1 Tax=Cylindrodendrum hubeiense TaxID=595255 RepID=A0A9P5HPZ2_9HYPO|nr:hypothetical protein G7Z17_g1552 [Cylindrodendrum hubeiense]
MSVTPKRRTPTPHQLSGHDSLGLMSPPNPNRSIPHQDRSSQQVIFKPVALLKQTIKFWEELLKLDDNPLRLEVDLASGDPMATSRLVLELSALLPDVGTAAEVELAEPQVSIGADTSPVDRWTKQRSVLQKELARLNIWKSDFGSRDMKLLLSEPSPLDRTISETIIELGESLLSCESLDL